MSSSTPIKRNSSSSSSAQAQVDVSKRTKVVVPGGKREDEEEEEEEEELEEGEREEEEEPDVQEEKTRQTKFNPWADENKNWVRPPLSPLNVKEDPLAIQCLDVEQSFLFVSSSEKEKLKKASIRIFGVNDTGNSVLIHVHDFLHYFFIPKPGRASLEEINTLASLLNQKVKDHPYHEKDVAFIKQCIANVEVVKRQSIFGFQFNEMSDFIKITVALPQFVSTCKKILEIEGLRHPTLGFVRCNTYESNLNYLLRFMVDKNIRGGGWIELPAGSYQLKPTEKKQSFCQLEVDVHYSQVLGHNPDGPWLKMAPLRILSFDIECAGRKGFFPTPEMDPIIQIASCVSLQATPSEPFIKNIFTLNACASISGSQVISNETERELLMNWLRFFVQADADIITGFNIINFDLIYLLERAKALGLEDFPFLGRIKNGLTTIKDSKFQSKALGIRESKSIKIEGRVQFDVLDVIRREYKLRSYTLNAVSAEFLNAQKEDVHHSIITDLQNGTDETRKRLAVYCLKDSLLPLQLIHKLMLLINYIEMARVTGVPISYLLTRGQQIKVISQLYRKAKQHHLVIPVRDSTLSDEKYEGATVIEPLRGYYTTPIATLDFASLYPSIMMAHNLCYSTYVPGYHREKIKAAGLEHTVSPSGDMFVKASVRKGILPEILIELLEARSLAKKMMKKAKDPLEQAVLNGRQLALKISANSVYGFTGAQVGQLPLLAISSSVTAFGREMIMHTKKTLENTYRKEKGYEFDCEIIYGDTDSVMIKFGPSDVKEVMRLGAAAADFVTKEFISPIKLEFEKVYYPYLLMNKKRYAGLYWTNPDKWDKLDSKGLETVRRDSCKLTSNSVADCLQYLLVERNPQMAIDYCKQIISDLLCNRIDLSLLVISKSLGKSASSSGYAAKQAHVELAERMRKRDPLSAPSVGDRVAYVITQQSKHAKAYEKAEDPLYVLDHDISIDAQYYINNQLKLPLTRIFEPILGDKVNVLFTGEHTRKIKVNTSSSSAQALLKFFPTRSGKRCVGCRALLEENQPVICSGCEPKSAQLYNKATEKVRVFEEEFSRAWSQCQRCQGSIHQQVLCQSRDCPIFYKRKKVQKDLNEAQKELDRFHF